MGVPLAGLFPHAPGSGASVLMDVSRPVVQDRSFYEDAEVFARSLHRQGAMTDRDWQTYKDLYRTLTTLLAPPDLVVYIKASVPTLQRRIRERGRDFETRITDAYLDGLNDIPDEEWIAGFSIAPVLYSARRYPRFRQGSVGLRGYRQRRRRTAARAAGRALPGVRCSPGPIGFQYTAELRPV